MTLSSPLLITSRLMPGFQVGGATVSLDCDRVDASGRMVYQVFIDLPDGTEHEITDLRSGVGGGSVRDGLSALCSFLSAAAESRAYSRHTGRKGDNEDLFPAAVVDWADQNSDEITDIGLQVEENPACCIED